MKAKKILVTAGNTLVPIDQVRSITNIFRGKTGQVIANHLAELGHDITLLTSAKDIEQASLAHVVNYRTFDDLLASMEELVVSEKPEVIIHSAAVSDYRVSNVFQTLEMTDLGNGKMQVVLQRLDNSGKISSEYDAPYLQLEPTQKIVDLIREPWGFTGQLVKFKLQVGISDQELLKIARRSRVSSKADLIVANCLEWMNERAYIVGDRLEESVTRSQLPEALARRLEL